MAPHSEWPQIIISEIFKENIENSIDAKAQVSSGLADKGGLDCRYFVKQINHLDWSKQKIGHHTAIRTSNKKGIGLLA